nr:hypothetical protein Itr_chr13CG16880 [Ipomoea trifida]
MKEDGAPDFEENNDAAKQYAMMLPRVVRYIFVSKGC